MTIAAEARDVEREGEATRPNDRRDADGRGYDNGLPEARGRLKSGRRRNDHEGGDEQDPDDLHPQDDRHGREDREEGVQPPDRDAGGAGRFPVERS